MISSCIPSLEEARDVIFEILENRELSSELRMALCLALAHDLQRRVWNEKLYEVDELLERYRVGNMCKAAQGADGMSVKDAGQAGHAGAGATVTRFCCRLASAGLEQYSRFETASELYTVFEKMEPLDPAWPERRDWHG